VCGWIGGFRVSIGGEDFCVGEMKLACPRDGPKVGANILSHAGQPT
jgi:hypothetical protein